MASLRSERDLGRQLENARVERGQAEQEVRCRAIKAAGERVLRGDDAVEVGAVRHVESLTGRFRL